jgi:hypothetical protein
LISSSRALFFVRVPARAGDAKSLGVGEREIIRLLDESARDLRS